jgi:AraC family transcriptional activator of pyochelin receptor
MTGPLPARTPAHRIDVSPEFSVVVGRGPFDTDRLPADGVGFVLTWGGAGAAASLRIVEPPSEVLFDAEASEHPDQLLLFVGRTALTRLGGEAPTEADRRGYHAPTELLAIAFAARDCAMEGEALIVYRAGKSMELLCEAIRLRRDGRLVPMPTGGAISLADSRRVMDARRMIDERCHEKLTLESIARACGLNRAKLTRGFREMFDCTIAEALSERRLDQARALLLTTDLPVSSIGYQAGYLNNASFARAFTRRFGSCPSDFRAAQSAA